jgi:hypothetical protein
MKNILSSLTQDEKSRILEMHKSATSKQYLSEQTPQPGTATQPTAAPQTGTTQTNKTLDRLNQIMGTSLPQNVSNEDVIKAYRTYLGTNINDMVGKTIVVFNNLSKQPNVPVIGATIQSEIKVGSVYFNGNNKIWIWNTPIYTNFDESKQDDGFTVTDDIGNAIRKGVSLSTKQDGDITDLRTLSYVKPRLKPNAGTFGMFAIDQSQYSNCVTMTYPSITYTGFFTITPFISGQGAQLSSTISIIPSTKVPSKQ